MNTSTEPHVDLEQMLAGVAGQPLSDWARDHLASCPHCRPESQAWAAARGGTQLLVTATDLPPWQFPAQPAARKPSRRALITAAAAAAVLTAGGTTWGVISSDAGAPATTTAGLTAVTGCPGLTATSGALEQIDGTSLVVRTQDGHDVTVSTGSGTSVRAEAPGSVSDIADGTQVLVHGSPQGSELAAQNVLVGLGPLLPPARPRGQAPLPPRASPGPGIAKGAVSEVHAGGFTVTQPTGHRVQVATSAATVVDTMVSTSIGYLKTGVHVIAVGHSEPDGRLAASTVEQGATLPWVETVPSRSVAGTCDPSAVASALAFGG